MHQNPAKAIQLDVSTKRGIRGPGSKLVSWKIIHSSFRVALNSSDSSRDCPLFYSYLCSTYPTVGDQEHEGQRDNALNSL